MRLYKATISRNARGDITQTEDAPVPIIRLRFERKIVRTAPGVDDIAEAQLISSAQLNIGDLLLYRSDDVTDVYRVMNVSLSSIGRHQYLLTRKLEDAA